MGSPYEFKVDSTLTYMGTYGKSDTNMIASDFHKISAIINSTMQHTINMISGLGFLY
jgi:hypothetical protein